MTRRKRNVAVDVERGKRLRWARESAGYPTASDAAKAFGWKYSTYAEHENGRKGINDELAIRYAKAYRVRWEWLLQGVGEPKDSKPGIKERRGSEQLDEPRVIPIESFEREDLGSSEERAAINFQGRFGLASDELPQVETVIEAGPGVVYDQTIEIPTAGGLMSAVPVVDKWKIPRYIIERGSIRFNNIHIIECIGDSMYPRILPGDFVFIDTGLRTPSPPGIFALYDGFGHTLKHVYLLENTDPPRVVLRAENPQYGQRELLLSEINIIGRFVYRLTTH